MAPRRVKNTVVRFGCHGDHRSPFALDGRDAPAVGVIDRAFRHGARFGRRDERLSLHPPPRATHGNFRVPEINDLDKRQ